MMFIIFVQIVNAILMKAYIYLLSFSLLFTATACRDNSPKPQPVAPASQLPSYSETGANTFGCLIDGEVFLPGKPAFSSYTTLQCEYQYVNGKYIFGLNAADNKSDLKNLVATGGNSSFDFIRQDSIYTLKGSQFDSLRGGGGRAYSDTNWHNDINYRTTILHKGELHIKNFNLIKQIVSGTFWFDAIDTTTGKIIHVTQGRFDTHFYR